MMMPHDCGNLLSNSSGLTGLPQLFFSGLPSSSDIDCNTELYLDFLIPE